MAPLSRFGEGEAEEAKDETEDEDADEVEDESGDEVNADADSEAGESEDEDEFDVEEDVEMQDDVDGRSTVTDRQSRVSSPGSSTDSWDSDSDPRDHPLFFTRIRKALPTKLCNICDC